MNNLSILDLQMLGNWSLSQKDRPLCLGRRQEHLLACVAFFQGKPRSFYCGKLWPDVLEPKALNSLRVALCSISKAAPGAITVRGSCLFLGDSVHVDVHDLSARLATMGSVPFAVPRLDNFVLLPDWDYEWIIPERRRLMERVLFSFESVAVDLFYSKDYHSAVSLANEILRQDPLRASAVRIVIMCELRLGNVSNAVRGYEAYERLLGLELGCKPDMETLEMVAQFI